MHISKEQDAAKSSDRLDCLQWKMPRQTYGADRAKQGHQWNWCTQTTCMSFEQSMQGNTSFLVFLDDATRHVWAYPMRRRAADELLEVFLLWLARAENQTGRKLKTFRGDEKGPSLERRSRRNSLAGEYFGSVLHPNNQSKTGRLSA